MNKLRKLGTWLWRSKERMLLAVVVVILCYQVWTLLHWEPLVVDPIPEPRREPPADWPGPPKPVITPVPPVRPSYEALVLNNPFTVYGSTEPADEKKPERPDLGVQLVAIRPWKNNEVRAEIAVRGKRVRIKEGDSIDQVNLRLDKIDAENQSVVLSSDEYGRIELTVGG